jgi:hypothetical protein
MCRRKPTGRTELLRVSAPRCQYWGRLLLRKEVGFAFVSALIRVLRLSPIRSDCILLASHLSTPQLHYAPSFIMGPCVVAFCLDPPSHILPPRLPSPFTKTETRGSPSGWVTVLQAGRSRVLFPVKSFDLSVELILAVALRTLRSTLTEVSTSRKVAGSIPREVIWFVSWANPSSRSMGPKVDSVTEVNTREGRPARKAENLTAICESIV